MHSQSMSRSILETLFDSKLRVKILKFLFRNAAASFSVRELANHVQDKPVAVKREIKALKEIGLVKVKK